MAIRLRPKPVRRQRCAAGQSAGSIRLAFCVGRARLRSNAVTPKTAVDRSGVAAEIACPTSSAESVPRRRHGRYPAPPCAPPAPARRPSPSAAISRHTSRSRTRRRFVVCRGGLRSWATRGAFILGEALRRCHGTSTGLRSGYERHGDQAPGRPQHVLRDDVELHFRRAALDAEFALGCATTTGAMIRLRTFLGRPILQTVGARRSTSASSMRGACSARCRSTSASRRQRAGTHCPTLALVHARGSIVSAERLRIHLEDARCRRAACLSAKLAASTPARCS